MSSAGTVMHSAIRVTSPQRVNWGWARIDAAKRDSHGLGRSSVLTYRGLVKQRCAVYDKVSSAKATGDGLANTVPSSAISA